MPILASLVVHVYSSISTDLHPQEIHPRTTPSFFPTKAWCWHSSSKENSPTVPGNRGREIHNPEPGLLWLTGACQQLWKTVCNQVPNAFMQRQQGWRDCCKSWFWQSCAFPLNAEPQLAAVSADRRGDAVLRGEAWLAPGMQTSYRTCIARGKSQSSVHFLQRLHSVFTKKGAGSLSPD